MATAAAGTQDYSKLMTVFNQGQDSFGDYTNLMGQADSLEMNAGLNDLNGKQVIADADFQARRMQEQGDRLLSNTRGKYAVAGVRSEGSPLEVMAYSERNMHLDILMTKLNAANKANQYGFEALQQRIAAGNAKTAAIAAMGRGLTSMVSTYAMGK